MSPGRIQDIVTAAGLGSTHDAVSAVASLTALFTDRKRMSALLAGLPDESREVLSRLVWGPPYGQVTADPASHLRRLLDLGLLVPTAPGTVVLPRGRPAPAGRARPPRAGAAAAARRARPTTVPRSWTRRRPGRRTRPARPSRSC
ncbi:hypothetical protein SALBM217S_01394 [Streptomyces griseoloalbus]